MNETAKGWNTMRRMHSGITYGSIQINGQKKCAGNHIHEKLYCRVWEEVKQIKEESYYFDLYFSGKGGNSAVRCSIVWKLQKTLLSEDQDWHYRKFDFDIVTEMVQILVYANGVKNKNEFPQINEYKLHAKLGYY